MMAVFKNIYNSIKKYLLGNSEDYEKDVFERVKIDLIFNLFFIFSIIYLLGFVSIIVNGSWYIVIARLIGIAFIAAYFYSLKKTKYYETPALLWVLSIVLFGIQGFIFNHGSLTFANLGYALLNISLVGLLLKRTLKVVFYVYYILFLTYGLALTYNLISPVWIEKLFVDGQNFNQSNLVFSVVPLFLLVYVLYIFISYEYKANKRLEVQIDAVKKQENEIKTAHQSMNKSIDLASRIQQAFFPDISSYKSFFKDAFLFLKPVHKLSGDFYWIAEKDDSMYFAVIDSTENNIAGAIVSSIYYDALDSAIKEKQIVSPSNIISYLNTIIKSKTDIKYLKGGIQISVIRIDSAIKKVYFAGEKNSLYFAAKGKKVIDEYKANQFYDETGCLKYREAEITYEEGDKVYLMSDGFASHFKGFSNVKFKESVFKSFITSIKNHPLEAQKDLIEKKLEEWIGEDAQSDDICLAAFML
ncbi:MAG: PP2C family protein-serine/threonine phosphatase [Crocinitomicaceae bacterium]